MTFEITEIPLPTSRVRSPKFPFTDLKVGGPALFIPAAKLGNISAQARNFGKSNGAKFLVRKLIKDGVEGVAVWRLA